MLRVDVTWLGYFMALVSLYYVTLYLLSTRRLARQVRADAPPRPGMALIVPAHNEELVIGGTLESLTRLDYEPYCVLVVNDGSTDETGPRARAFEHTGRVHVFDRPLESAGMGKGAVLNEGYRILQELLARRDPLVAGFDPNNVVVGVVDADGHLERNALKEIARHFDDPMVGGVQMGVVIG